MPDTTTQPRDSLGRPTDHSPDAIHARYETACTEVSDLCRGIRQWSMSIPARPGRDSDLVITDALEDIPRLLARAQAVRDLHQDDGDGWCKACTFSYPCATIRALDGDHDDH
ncbi:MAG TPA: hypothetical protein VIS06_20655 [Mycobacteriales bacterium]|jgi:hypothetical protein